MIETMSFLYFLFLAKKKKNGAGNSSVVARGRWHGLAHGRLGSRQRWLSAMKDVAFLRQVRRVTVKERTYFSRKEIRTCFFRLLKKVIYIKKSSSGVRVLCGFRHPSAVFLFYSKTPYHDGMAEKGNQK